MYYQAIDIIMSLVSAVLNIKTSRPNVGRFDRSDLLDIGSCAFINMAFQILMLPTIFLSILASHLVQVISTHSSSPSNSSTSSACIAPTGFANIIIRAPLPSSPTLQIEPSFFSQHLLFYYTDQNTALSQAAFASFCLDQCIAYQPNHNPANLSTGPGGLLPASYVTSRPGPCLSFTVDVGKPYPPNPNDTAPRWFCEAYDTFFAQDLSDYVPVDAPGSFMYSLGVNRACGGIRAY